MLLRGYLQYGRAMVCAVRLNSENMFSAGHFHLLDLVFFSAAD